MANTPYIVDFCPSVRVYADPDKFSTEEDLYEYLWLQAREIMKQDIDRYLSGENGDYQKEI